MKQKKKNVIIVEAVLLLILFEVLYVMLRSIFAEVEPHICNNRFRWRILWMIQITVDD